MNFTGFFTYLQEIFDSATARTALVSGPEEFQTDLLHLLADDPQQGFYFARYKDELIDLTIDAEPWECFGLSPLGPLLLDSQGMVWAHITDHAGFGDSLVDKRTAVNKNLERFIDCYAAFERSLWSLRTTDGVTVYAPEFERAAEAAIQEIDSTAYASDDALWPVLVFSIADGLRSPIGTTHEAYAAKKFDYWLEPNIQRPTGSQRWRTDRTSSWP